MQKHFFGALAAAALAACAVAPAQELTPATFDRLRERIDVKADELRWQQVRWVPFWDGLVAAQQQDRPIFYWIYFGDPRGGC
jgi:putative VirB-like lipoprotein